MNARIRQFLHDEWLQLVIIVVPVIAAVAAMPFVTQPVPMLWNLRGQVNWYVPREWSLLVLPVSMALIYGIWFWRESLDRDRLDPGGDRLTSHGKATRAIRLMMSTAVVVLCFIQITCALGWHPDLGRLASAAVPLLLASVGNVFGKLKPNRYMGVRVPWTLRSESVWRKTHRVTGRLYVFGGLAAGLLCLLVPASYVAAVLVAWLSVLIFAPLGVAWLAAREERTRTGIQPTGITLGWAALIEALLLIGIIALYFQQIRAVPGRGQQSRAAQAAPAPDRHF